MFLWIVKLAAACGLVWVLMRLLKIAIRIVGKWLNNLENKF